MTPRESYFVLASTQLETLIQYQVLAGILIYYSGKEYLTLSKILGSAETRGAAPPLESHDL